MSIIGTTIWGSSSLGVVKTAKSPKSSDARTSKGVRGEFTKAFAILPAKPSSLFLKSIFYLQNYLILQPSQAFSVPETTISSPGSTPDKT